MKQQTLKLNEICEIITSPVDKKSYAEETPVLLCNYTDVYYNEFITKDINFMKATASDNEIKRYSLYKGDVVITKDSETPDDIGISTYIAEDIENLVCGYHLAILRPNTKYVNGLYLAYYLKLQQVLHIFGRFANGITRYSLINATYKAVSVLLPPLEEQKKIAEILSLWDKAIEQTKELIAYKEKQKKGLMQALLTGKKRLNGFTDEWKTVKLGEICSITTGNKNNEDKIENGLYPFFVRSKQIEKINSYSYDGEAILVPGDGNIGDIYHYINGKFDFHQRVYKISDFKSIYAKFLFYNMQLFFKKRAISQTSKATVNSLRMDTFTQYNVFIPYNVAEQKAIADILSSADKEIELLNKQLELYTEQKKGLMQNLLTGKVRV